MYEILIERTAERDLKRLSAKDFHLIVPHIKALADEPRPKGCRKLLFYVASGTIPDAIRAKSKDLADTGTSRFS